MERSRERWNAAGQLTSFLPMERWGARDRSLERSRERRWNAAGQMTSPLQMERAMRAPPVGGMATEGPLAPAPAWLPGCFVLFLTRSRWPASLPRSLFGSVSVFGAVLKTIRIPLSLLRRFSCTVDSGERPSSKYSSSLYFMKTTAVIQVVLQVLLAIIYYSVIGYRRGRSFKALPRGSILRTASCQEPNAIAFWLKTRRKTKRHCV